MTTETIAMTTETIAMTTETIAMTTETIETTTETIVIIAMTETQAHPKLPAMAQQKAQVYPVEFLTIFICATETAGTNKSAMAGTY
jgi:predicted secreted protein